MTTRAEKLREDVAMEVEGTGDFEAGHAAKIILRTIVDGRVSWEMVDAVRGSASDTEGSHQGIPRDNTSQALVTTDAADFLAGLLEAAGVPRSV